MLKKNYVKRIMAGILAAVMTMTTAWSGAGTVLNVEAASTYEAQNLLVNPDFEESTAFGAAGKSHLGNWFAWQSAAKTTDVVHGGTTAAKFTANDSALEQDIEGDDLVQGMTYVYTVWAKLSKDIAEGSRTHSVGVKNYGGTELKQFVTSSEWKKYEIEFVYNGNSDPRVYGYIGTHNGADLYIDDASVTAKGEIERASIENGKLTVKFADTFTGTPATSDFTANYKVAEETANALTWTDGSAWNADTKTMTLNFAPVAAKAVAQTVTVNLTYGTMTITVDYTVDANGEEVVTANLVSVSAENGSVQAVLDQVPTVAPKMDDFTWEYKMGDGEYKALSVDGFVFNSETKTVSATFGDFRSTTATTVTVKVTYETVSKEASFDLAATTASTYYVDATNGNDANDGLSEEKALRSIAQLNKITFLPGDQILFKKGETFVGCFKPQGSGSEGAPITIGSYGTGDQRPVLQPGADWTVTHVMSANAMVKNAKVNYVLQFYNVEYWEVSDLEIYDPNSEAYLTKGSDKYIGNSANDVYRSGITIQAEDIGTLEHIYVDNVIVHGFHGPGTNIGKTSGGITMNIITNAERNRANSTPTQINDIRITNCEIYDVGRSGINFLTPWSFRTDEKWGPFGYGTRGYDYLPYEDFYMGNNYIHDIDGDGTIIDNCANAVSEYNLVTRCSLRPATEGGGAAVGLFNWNSDDTYFQFNEVYDVRLGVGSSASNDGQGIEIDALNDRTWVQYNYVHDNMGGFMMLCNVGDGYRSFDGIVRYNISQNDYAHPRQGLFDIYSANYGTEIYNNTFYFTKDRTLKDDGELFLFSAVAAYEPMKFYNNIFYYAGETPVVANKFGDEAIDWQSNIFYGFANLPENDNENAPNISADPKVVNIGQGGTGTAPGKMPDLSCYYLQDDSPAINAGVPLKNNGSRDFFGNKVTGIPDVGAYETGSVVLKLLSMTSDILVSQDERIITVTDLAKVTTEKLLDNLCYEDGVTVSVKRGTRELADGVRVADGDVVTAQYKVQKISYTVKVVEAEKSEVVPVEHLNATAGSQETSSENNAAANAIDGNIGTIWHTSWSGAAEADRYLTLEIKDGYEYDLSGYVYTPRTGAKNGTITKYEILVSDDNATWKSVASGDWTLDDSAKTVRFDKTVKAKYVKLLAVAGVGNYASAAEVRLLGTLIDTEAPTAPTVTSANVKANSVEIQWTEANDNHKVTDYFMMLDGKEFAVFDPDVLSYKVEGLEKNTVYQFEIYAVDEVGNRSEAGKVTVTTLDEEDPSEKPSEKDPVTSVFTDVESGKWYVDAVQYVYNTDLMSGFQDQFTPEANMSRAMVVTTLYRMEGSPEVTDYSAYLAFKDVKADDWYADAVAWALNNDIATGDPVNQKFNPNANVTREQLAAFLYRYTKFQGLSVTEKGDLSGMKNADKVNTWALKEMQWAVGKDLISGIAEVKDNQIVARDLAPQGNATRAQMATILQRYCEGK